MPLLPPDPVFTSSGERDVWNALKPSVEGTDLLATNVRFTDPDGDHEGDLIVGLAGAGIAVIEVKGGRVTHDGTDWVQHGAVSKRIHPVDQARRTKYALRSFLNGQDRWSRRNVRLAHVVAFPYSSVPRGFSLPDCPRSMILDRHDLADRPLTALREAILAQDIDTPVATAADIAAAVDCLAPTITLPGEEEVQAFETQQRSDRNRVLLVLGASALVLLAIVGLVFAAGRNSSASDPVVIPDGATLLTLDPSSPKFDAAATAILCSNVPLPELDFSEKIEWPAMILQNELNKDYTRKVAVDGVYRLDTMSAVQWFQLANDITVTGYIGPNSWKHLRAIRCDGGPTPPAPDLSSVPAGNQLFTLDPRSAQFDKDATSVLCSNYPLTEIAHPLFHDWETLIVQHVLDKYYGNNLKVTGDFDQATAAAVQRFQSDKQVTVTGIVGPESWQQLRNIACKA